ncbi:MAG: hypothetical protein H7Y18_20195 [Clostridiaceae bacterium]|nr:hypothetical protein [Clostridiaceae bacterium]
MQCKICGYINSFTIRGEGGKCYQCGAPLNSDNKNISSNFLDKRSSLNSNFISGELENGGNRTEDMQDVYKWFSTGLI